MQSNVHDKFLSRLMTQMVALTCFIKPVRSSVKANRLMLTRLEYR